MPPLLHHKKDTFRLQLLADVLAIAVYVSLIAVDLDGWDWYLHLALPIILLLGALFLFWGLTMGQRKRSTLSSIALVIGSSGVFTLGVEGLIDGYLHGSWSPSWSLIVLAICVILLIPLIVIRRVPRSGRRFVDVPHVNHDFPARAALSFKEQPLFFACVNMFHKKRTFPSL